MVTTTIRVFSAAPLTLFKNCSTMWTRREMRKQVADTLRSLLAKNKQEIEAAHPYLDIVYNDKITEFIFSVAKTLSLSNETKYQALEIYQRFILSYLDSCVTCSKEDLSNDKALKIKARKIQEETTPKALACVLIASKLTSNKSLFASTLASSLSWLKLHPRDICRYEIQILKHLEFRCCKVSPVLEYIGAAVSVAGLWYGGSDPFTSKVKGLDIKRLSAECVQETAVELLDFVYLNREQVYEKLCHFLTGRPPRRTTQFRAKFARVLADRMLLAGSVVVAAAGVLGGTTAVAPVVASLCFLIPVTPKDLLIFATCILESVHCPLPAVCDILHDKLD